MTVPDMVSDGCPVCCRPMFHWNGEAARNKLDNNFINLVSHDRGGPTANSMDACSTKPDQETTKRGQTHLNYMNTMLITSSL